MRPAPFHRPLRVRALRSSRPPRESDTRFVPSFLKGERDLFVAVGSVDGIVDFDQLDTKDVTVSRDRRTAVIHLPHARFGEVRVDPKRSYVYSRRRGILDRIGSGLFIAKLHPVPAIESRVVACGRSAGLTSALP